MKQFLLKWSGHPLADVGVASFCAECAGFGILRSDLVELKVLGV